MSIHWTFPCPVRRVRYTGTLDPPTTMVTFNTPVLAGGQERHWTRELQIDFAAAADLPGTYAHIHFWDIDNVEHNNRWPRRHQVSVNAAH
ncbi:hypothetical protein ACN27G_13185 [Plantactinospora sp. WMMB334]|uniref:hypothetical protein n=1 Tax=Plantactinospora sp. WMMB334 TaxID=3404119 RepID=UPI003B95623B